MSYYINLVFLYSFLGFTLESVVFKYYNVNMHSSIFLGPYTLVYGFGMLFCILIYNQLNTIIVNNLFTYFLYYLIFVFITSLIEFIGGHLIHFFLHIDKWNYSNHKYHIGKYLTLENSLIWGILALSFIKFIHPFFNLYILYTIPKTTTLIILFIFFIDLLFLIKKIKKS